MSIEELGIWARSWTTVLNPPMGCREQILIKTEETNEIEMDSENSLATMCITSERNYNPENSLVSMNIKSEPNCDEDPLNIENQN